MDIDISDILADVSRPNPPSRSRPSHQNQTSSTTTRPPSTGPPPPYLDDPSSSAFLDHQLLTRSFVSERNSPELLPYPSALLSRVMERIQMQIGRIEELASGGGYEDSSANRGHGSGGGAGNVNLVLSILQTDLGRTQYLVRALLRVRLGKVGRWGGWYERLVEEEGGEGESKSGGGVVGGGEETVAGGLLSVQEAAFLRKRQVLLRGFYEGSFLSGMPGKMRRLDEGGTGEGGMLEGPGREGVVVVRCLVGEWGNEGEVGRERGCEVELRMGRGQVWVVRWGDVRVGVLEGKLEVL